MNVHCFVNKANGLSFVDVASQVRDERLGWHLNVAKIRSNHPFYADLLANGTDGFEALTLESSIPAEKIEEAKARWVRLLGSNIPALGYNLPQA